jgi:hypothetical protein
MVPVSLIVVLGLCWLVTETLTLTLLVMAGRADRLRAYGRKLTMASTGSRSGTRDS